MDVPSRKVVVALELIPISKSPLGSDIPKGTTGQPSMGYLQAMIPSTKLKTIGRDLLWVSEIVHSYLGPRLGPGMFKLGLKVQNGDRVI